MIFIQYRWLHEMKHLLQPFVKICRFGYSMCFLILKYYRLLEHMERIAFFEVTLV